MNEKAFLTANWESLLIVNYECPSELLEPYVPAGVELDYASAGDEVTGTTFISIVAFMFRNTRVLGAPIPFHRTFAEVNLRFYVKRRMSDGEVRRGVVFIRELVPRRAVAMIARYFYNEPYVCVPMSHAIAIDPFIGGLVAYRWKFAGREYKLAASVNGHPYDPPVDSQTEFITEHYWGYTRQANGSTLEYRVDHPRWSIWDAPSLRIDGDLGALYGERFAAVFEKPPRSAFVAVGSPVTLYRGVRVPAAIDLREDSSVACLAG